VGVFPASLPGLDSGTYWLMGAAGALGLFLSIVFHEMWHSIIDRRYGLAMDGITLFIFGGVAEMKTEPADPPSEFWMAVAGPISSVCLAGGFWMLASGLTLAHLVGPLSHLLGWLGTINLILAAFNLIPGFPLDGGRILRSALWYWRKDLRWATRTATTIGSGFGMGLLLLGVFAILSWNFIGGLWWFLIGLFIRNAARQGYEQILVRGALRGEPVRKFMSAEPVVVPPDISVEQLVEDFVYRFHFKMFPVSENGKLNGCISTREIQDIPRRQWAFRRVCDVLTQCSVDNTITPDRDAMDALAQMNRSKTSRLLVVEGDRLVGVITLKDLLEFLALKLELEGVDAPKGLRDATGDQADDDRRAA
jgi:Zn-dependent protease